MGQGASRPALPAPAASGGIPAPPAGPRNGGSARTAAKSVIGELAATAVMLGGLMFALKITLSYMDPYREQRKEAKRQANLLKQRLGRSLDLNEYEQLLASSVLNPHHIDVSLDDIGGMEGVKRDMRLRVLRPLREHDAVSALLWRPVKGVLLYGPPGTGKTMLAKAMAREADCFFLNITASSVLSKWYGDAQKFVRAIFTLASKLEPCIIFIDEVDAFLTKRGGASEHEASLSAKTEFMQLWDGIEGARGMRVLVMGATNRPWCIDEAVLRRFGLQYEVGLPGPDQRRQILGKYLLRHEAESRALRRAGFLAPGEGGVDQALLEDRPVGALPGAMAGEGCLSAVVRATDGYSGSDLTELCAQAAQDVLAEKWAMEEGDAAGPARLRQLRGGDLLSALALVRPSTSRASEYAVGQFSRSGSGPAGPGGETDPSQWLLAAMSALAAAGGGGGGDGAGGSAPAGARAAGASGGGVRPGGASGGSGGGDGALGFSDEQLRALGLLVANSIRMGAVSGAGA